MNDITERERALLARDEPHRQALSAIGATIGYGRAQQILGELWDAMLQESYGAPPGRGGMGVTVDDSLPPIPKAASLRRQQRTDGGYEMVPAYSVSELKAFGHAVIADQADRAERAAPLDMVLYCPNCGKQHVDAPEQTDRFLAKSDPPAAWSMPPWENKPHRSHLCHSCGTIWRPADVATNGVANIKTTGKNDTWVGKAPFAAPAIPSSGAGVSK